MKLFTDIIFPRPLGEGGISKRGTSFKNSGEGCMKALIQRVKRASVTIEGKLFSSIDNGLLVFLGVQKATQRKMPINFPKNLAICAVLKTKRKK